MSCGDCQGVCCVAFPWNRTPAQLQRWPHYSGGSTSTESKYIADMLIPLTPEQARHRHESFGVGHDPLSYADKNWYTCRHWDKDTKLCTAYEERPRMCREFPYRNECEHEGCSYRLPPDRLAAFDRYDLERGWGPLEIVLGEN